MRMLGIDPGLTCTGWGIIEKHGNALLHLGHGQIRTETDQDDHQRLQMIFDGILAVCQEYGPMAASIESVFVAKNAKSALKLGIARGAAMAACSSHGLPLREIAPRLAKKAVTGTGTADKKQMQAMVAHLLGIVPKGADAADALGLAIAGIHEAANGLLVDNNGRMADQSGVGLAKAASSGKSIGGRGLSAAIAAALAKEQKKGL